MMGWWIVGINDHALVSRNPRQRIVLDAEVPLCVELVLEMMAQGHSE